MTRISGPPSPAIGFRCSPHCRRLAPARSGRDCAFGKGNSLANSRLEHRLRVLFQRFNHVPADRRVGYLPVDDEGGLEMLVVGTALFQKLHGFLGGPNVELRWQHRDKYGIAGIDGTAGGSAFSSVCSSGRPRARSTRKYGPQYRSGSSYICQRKTGQPGAGLVARSRGKDMTYEVSGRRTRRARPGFANADAALDNAFRDPARDVTPSGTSHCKNAGSNARASPRTDITARPIAHPFRKILARAQSLRLPSRASSSAARRLLPALATPLPVMPILLTPPLTPLVAGPVIPARLHPTPTRRRLTALRAAIMRPRMTMSEPTFTTLQQTATRITHSASTLAGLGKDDEMTMGPREVVLPTVKSRSPS